VAAIIYTGVPEEDMLALRVDDVDLAKGVMFIRRRKGNKYFDAPQPFPIHSDLKPILREWLPETRSIYLFPGVEGGRWVGSFRGTRPHEEIEAAAFAAGIQESVTYRTLRRFHFEALESSVEGLGLNGLSCPMRPNSEPRLGPNRVVVGGPQDPISVHGTTIGVLTTVRYNTLKALWKAGKKGLTGSELKREAGAGGAVNAWNDMRNLYPALRDVLPRPGKGYRGTDARYRLLR